MAVMLNPTCTLPPPVIATVVPRSDPKRMRMDQILLGLSGMGLSADSAAVAHGGPGGSEGGAHQ